MTVQRFNRSVPFRSKTIHFCTKCRQGIGRGEWRVRYQGLYRHYNKSKGKMICPVQKDDKVPNEESE